MENISAILQNRKIVQKQSKRPVNLAYEEAKQIADYTGLQVFVIMRMQKKYGREKVARLSGFLRDYPNLDPKRVVGLAHWFLKNK